MWKGILYKALPYIVYVRERYYYSLVSTFKEIIKTFSIKVDVQKGVLGFRDKFDKDMIISPNLCFHLLLSYGNHSQWLPSPILLGFSFEFYVFQIVSKQTYGLANHVMMNLYDIITLVLVVCVIVSYILWMKFSLVTFPLESES